MSKDESTGRQATSDRLADAITADIQSGALAPGLWLKQIDIEQRYGVTRNTARNALNKLALQRFVVHEPNRGHRVPSMDGRKRIELLRIRVLLEVSIVPEIVANATTADVAELRKLAREFNKLLPGAEFRQLIEINAAFHKRMQQMSGNTEAVRMIQDLRQTMRPYRGTTWNSVERIRQSADEHMAMVKALERRDVDALMQVVAAHVGKDDIGGVRLVEVLLPAA
jgi:DNA-binding GntR family transcriptional regulator